MGKDFPPYKDYRIRVEALDLTPDGWKWKAWITPMSGDLANEEILVIGRFRCLHMRMLFLELVRI